MWRTGLSLWAWVARRPALYHALAEIASRALGWAGGRRGRFRSLPLAAGWTAVRDMPAPGGPQLPHACGPSGCKRGARPVSGARADILAGIRRSLRRGRSTRRPRPSCARGSRRIAATSIPARAAALDHAGQIDLFVAMAEEVQATVTRVPSAEAVPEAVARYLAAENLPAELVMAPDPGLDDIPWETRPLLRIRRGRAEPEDAVSLTPCFAAVAETGTLMLVSGPQTPTTLNFLPDTHIAVVRAGQVVASYEDGWDRLRAATARQAGDRLAAGGQFHHRAVAHRRHRAAHRAGRARAAAAAYRRRRGPAGSDRMSKDGQGRSGSRAPRSGVVGRGDARRDPAARPPRRVLAAASDAHLSRAEAGPAPASGSAARSTDSPGSTGPMPSG